MIDFFKKTYVKIASWIVLCISVVVLILGGASVADLSSGMKLVAAIFAAVSALVAFISERVKK